MSLKKNKIRLLLPFYHQVVDSVCLFSNHLYASKTVTQFKLELDYLLKHYQPISLTELIQVKKNNAKLQKPSFHLTFDDGLSNFYHIVAPILRERNITATVFLNTDFIDNKELFYRYKVNLLLDYYQKSDSQIQTIFNTYFRNENIKNVLKKITFEQRNKLDKLAEKVDFDFSEFLKEKKPYLSTTQIKELQDQGFTFGAHSKNHPLYASIDLKEQISQTVESLAYLQEKINVKHDVFSFPFHDIGVSKVFFNKIKPKVDLTFGTSGLKEDEFTFHLHRLDMEKSTGEISKYMNLAKNKYKLKKIVGLNKINRK